MLNLQTTREDAEIIRRIARRANAAARRAGVEYSVLTAWMDVSNCHVNACPLELEALATAPLSEFQHDVFGIRRHIDRHNGTMGGCFLPRYALELTR